MYNTLSRLSVDHEPASDRAKSVGFMKARQSAKIAELRQILLQAGYHSLGKQASALGLSRSTTWAVLQANHKSSGLSGCVIKRMLRSPGLPSSAKLWLEEIYRAKIGGIIRPRTRPPASFPGSDQSAAEHFDSRGRDAIGAPA